MTTPNQEIEGLSAAELLQQYDDCDLFTAHYSSEAVRHYNEVRAELLRRLSLGEQVEGLAGSQTLHTELVHLAADVAHGKYLLDLEGCKTIREVRYRQERQEDGVRLALVERLNKLRERFKATPEPIPGPRCPEAFLEAVDLAVSELPDRSSPDDWPEAMLVTGPELREIIKAQWEEFFSPVVQSRQEGK